MFLKRKNKKEENQLASVDFQKINKGIDDYINNASFLQDYSVDVYRDFVELEKSIKPKTSEAKNSIKNIKNFLEKSSKDNFYLKNFLQNLLEAFNDLSLDSVSLLKNRRFFYYSLSKILSQEIKKTKSNKGIILNAEVFRYGGDEFAAIISRDAGVEIMFFDLMYLNYFNDLMGYKGGDLAIYTSSRIIEDTLKSFIGKATKTRNMADNILKNFSEFEFNKDNSVLNKIIFNIDIGYSNNLEIEEIEKEFLKDIKGKKIKTDKTLLANERMEILVNLAEIRASIQKKVSKLYLLTKLYDLSEQNKEIRDILNGYLAFTKNPFFIEKIVKDIYIKSKNDRELLDNIIKESIEIEREKEANVFNSKNINKERILLEKIFNKSIKNISIVPNKMSIDNIVKKWGID